MTDKSPEERQALKRAVRILSRRGLGKEELYARLLEKGEGEEASRHAVERMEELQLLNDGDYAAGILNSLRNKGYGARRVRAELEKRKLNPQLTGELMSSFEPDWDAAVRYLSGKLGEAPEKGQIKKAYDCLIRRGFSWEEATQALRLWQEMRETENEEGRPWA